MKFINEYCAMRVKWCIPTSERMTAARMGKNEKFIKSVLDGVAAGSWQTWKICCIFVSGSSQGIIFDLYSRLYSKPIRRFAVWLEVVLNVRRAQLGHTELSNVACDRAPWHARMYRVAVVVAFPIWKLVMAERRRGREMELNESTRLIYTKITNVDGSETHI